MCMPGNVGPMIEINDLSDKSQTAREMYRLTDEHSSDIDHFEAGGTPLSNLPLLDYYRLVRGMPYLQDIPAVEVVSRPYYVLAAPWRGLDCKKKSILVGSWARENGIPYRYVAVSRRPDRSAHHVIPELQINGEWVEVDATYGWNRPFQEQSWTSAEVLSGQNDSRLSDSPVLVSLSGGIDQLPQAVGWLRQNAPELLGAAQVVPIITAIIAAVGTTTAAIIGAVSAKKNRELAHASLKAGKARTDAELEIAKLQAAKAASETGLPPVIEEYGIPAAIGTGLFALKEALL